MKRIAKTMPVSVNSKYQQQKNGFKTTRVATLDPINPDSEEEPLIELDFEFNSGKTKRNVGFRGKNIQIDHTPPLPPPSSPSFQSIFDKKIQSCCQICNFNYSDADISAKAMKETLLEHFLTLLSNEESSSQLSPENVQKLLNMIAVNTLRKFESVEQIAFISEANVNIAAKAWPHLQYIYQILLLLVKQHPDKIPVEFAEKIVPLLNSTDQNERVQVKFFFGGYCLQKPELQNQIIIMLLKTVVDYLNKVVPPYGIASVLEIVRELSKLCSSDISSIIIENYILPLFKTNHLSFFISEMKQTVEYFMEKEQRNVNLVIDYLLRYFPKTKMIKQVYFLNILTESIPKLTQRDFSSRITKIFSIYGWACKSPSSKVSDAAFRLWSSLEVQAIIGIFANKVFPIALPILFSVAQDHWSQGVRQNAVKAIEFANKTDKKIVTEFQQSRGFMNKESEEASKWEKIAELASIRDKNVNVQKIVESFTNRALDNVQHLQPIQHSQTNIDNARPGASGRKLSALQAGKNGSAIIVQPKFCYK
ncbi:hypothetical protein TRFO_08609 [Tritrichomonas foetus]|uniref:Phosphoprotein phosphatase n=1 Tax=Tritrichomonas foetus TaxID=1144522 RepID=A0A1J4JKB0_9EUKA|nr:hypothetical protein TRFO_08609 [Tritrichomonas foetus]|eukprot:OHS99049.1 hypothetical protein TRFO_08609 [Tritrichomonas foetus]